MTDHETNDRPTRAYPREDVYDAIESIRAGELAPPYDMPLWQAAELLLTERGVPYTMLS